MWWMGLIQAGVGIAQTAIAASEASKIPENKKYSVSPELRNASNMALRTAQQGASATERLQYEQDQARRSTAAGQMFRNVGLSGAGVAAQNIMGADALNEFAARNSDIMRQGRNDYANIAGQIQSINNQEVTSYNTQRNMERQATGGAMQAGIGNVIGGINSGSNALLANKSIDTYGKIAANANNDLGVGGGSVGGGGGGVSQSPYANNPSPIWGSYESQGAPFLPSNQQSNFFQGPQSQQTPMVPASQQYNQFMPNIGNNFNSPSFGPIEFGAVTTPIVDWDELWGRKQ